MKTPVDIYVIEAVRRERMAQHVSQAMLAFGIGVSKSFIGMAESPKYEIKYNLNHINEIARFLGWLAAQVPARGAVITPAYVAAPHHNRPRRNRPRTPRPGAAGLYASCNGCHAS